MAGKGAVTTLYEGQRFAGPHGDLGDQVTPVDRSPSRVGYWVGGGVMVLGVVAAVLWFVLGLLSFSNEVKGFERVPVDGESRQVNLPRAGSYTAYYEPNFGSADESAPAVDAEIEGPDGRNVDLTPYRSSLTYDNMGGHSGRAVFTFQVDSPGTYEVRSSSTSAGELALGRGVGNKLVASIVGTFVIGLVGIGIGALVLIITAVRRSSSRRRAP